MYYFVNGGAPNNPGFNALPDYVQKKIIANMMYGGSKLNRYQDGSEYQPDQEETYFPADDSMQYSSGNQMIPGAAFEPAPNYGMVGPQMPIGYTPMKTPAPSSYKGISIVDFLASQGKAYDKASRKELAKTLGISGYTGKDYENMKMLKMLVNDPSLLDIIPSVGAPKKGAGRRTSSQQYQPTEEELNAFMAEEVARQAGQNPYVVAPNVATSQNVTPEGLGWVPSNMNFSLSPAEYAQAFPPVGPAGKSRNYLGPAAAIAGTAAGTYLGARMIGAKNIDLISDLARANVKADDIIAYAKKFGRDNNTFDILKAKGMNPKDINIALKGVKFNPSATQQMMDMAQMSGITGKSVKQAGQAINAANVERAKKLVEVMKMRGGIRDPKLVAQIYKMIGNPAEANALMKGLKFGPAAVKAGKVASFLSKFGKYFEEGGELDQYQDRGEVLPRPIPMGDSPYDQYGNVYMFDSNYPDTWQEDVLEFFDLSGLSSHDDIREMRRMEQIDPESVNWFDKAMTYASAIPVFGEVGKIGKGLKGFGKYLIGAEKAAEKMNKIEKAVAAKKTLPGKVWTSTRRSVGPALDVLSGGPLVRMGERINPITMGTSRIGEKVFAKAPKSVKAASKVLGNVGRIGRGKDVNTFAAAQKVFGANAREVPFLTPDGKAIMIDIDDPRLKNLESSVSGVDPETGAFILNDSGAATFTDTSSVPVMYTPPPTQGNYNQVRGRNWKDGGSYSGTYTNGVYYQDGGMFTPNPMMVAQGMLPKYTAGSQMKYGGSKKKTAGSEMYVTPEEMERLRQQGYDFDVIG